MGQYAPLAERRVVEGCTCILSGVLTEEPKDLSGLMILLINPLMTMSLCPTQDQGVPQEGCPSHAEKVGMTMYWRSKGK